MTASTDLKGAVAAGPLAPMGAGRARHYVTGPNLYRLIGRRLGIDIDDSGEPARNELIAVLIARAQETARWSPGLRARSDR